MGYLIFSDGRTFGDLPCAPAVPRQAAPSKALHEAMEELKAAAPDPVRACDEARVAFWKKMPHLLEDLCPGLICPPQGEADARRMLAWADHMAEWPHLTGPEARDCRALRIYAAEVRAQQEAA